MKTLFISLLLLLTGCSSLSYQEWKPGQKIGFVWTDQQKCEKITVGTGIKYSKCFK